MGSGQRLVVGRHEGDASAEDFLDRRRDRVTAIGDDDQEPVARIESGLQATSSPGRIRFV